jgi:iron complex outermembrane receptor protein
MEKHMPRLTGLPRSLLLGILTIMFIAPVPLPGYTEELNAQPDQPPIPEPELIKEEETVSIASRHEQPISQAPANVYVITDEDIRHSGATDIPTLLRRIPGMEVMQTTGADFNVSVRGDNQLSANKLLVMVDGRSIYVDFQGQVYWKAIPVTLPEIKRIEVLKGPASVLLRGAYKFWQQKAEAGYLREAEAAVSAVNAMNDTHEEHPLGDTIGSLVIGWLTVRL